MGCGRAVKTQISVDPVLLGSFLGVKAPASARQIFLAARKSKHSLLLHARLEMEDDDFKRFIEDLGLVRGGQGVPNTFFLKREVPNNEWWTPPAPLDQLSMKEKYCPADIRLRDNQTFSVIKSENVVYVFVFIGSEPMNTKR